MASFFHFQYLFPSFLVEMNSKELQTLIDRNFLTSRAISIYFRVPESTVRNWIDGKEGIVSSYSTALKMLDYQFERCVNVALSMYKKHKENLGVIRLIRYTNEDDFFEYASDAETFKTVLIHQAYLARAVDTLNRHFSNIRLVEFDQTSYRKWLIEKNLPHSRTAITSWSAESQKAKPKDLGL